MHFLKYCMIFLQTCSDNRRDIMVDYLFLEHSYGKNDLK